LAKAGDEFFANALRVWERAAAGEDSYV
jgi:hypothetical protein